VPTLETPMSPGGSQASAGEGLSPCNIGIGIGSLGFGTCQALGQALGNIQSCCFRGLDNRLRCHDARSPLNLVRRSLRWCSSSRCLGGVLSKHIMLSQLSRLQALKYWKLQVWQPASASGCGSLQTDGVTIQQAADSFGAFLSLKTALAAVIGLNNVQSICEASSYYPLTGLQCQRK